MEGIVAAFEVWGIQQTSAFYSIKKSKEELDAFIERHNSSNSFASLRTFGNVDEAWDEYSKLNDI